MLNFRKYAVLIAIFTFTFSLALEDDVERFTHLKKEGIYDPSVSNQIINEMLREGIESADSQINRLTLLALGELADSIIQDFPGPFETIVERSIQDVPRLKSYLIAHWKVEHARSGNDASAQIKSDLEPVDPTPSNQASQPNSGANEIEEEVIAAFIESLKDRISPWIRIPTVLCVFWPNDPEVHELIWQYHGTDSSVQPIQILQLLNAGKFVTSKANDFRISQLVAYRIEEGIAADLAVSLAAQGLALSRPIEAIPSLITAGIDHIDPRAEVLITLAGYDDAALDPYHSELVSLVKVPRNTLPPTDEIQRALNRLVRFVNN